MFGFLKSFFQPKEEGALFGAGELRVDEDLLPSGQIASVRRWDGSLTTKANASQFQNVTGLTINEDLVNSLPTLIRRCLFEATTNPTIEGMIDTHAIDIVGPDGPQWQVLPRDPTRLKGNKRIQEAFVEYAESAEEVLQDWFKAPELNGDMSGVEILQMDIAQQWATGNSVVQVVLDESVSTRSIQTRWHPIHSERVFSNTYIPVTGPNAVVLGIKRNQMGKRLSYFVQDVNEYGQFTYSNSFQEIPAQNIIHRFRCREPGQICGVPWMASSLATIADIRQYDKLVMEASKLAASFGIVFEDKFQDSPTKVKRPAGGVMESIKIGLAQILHAPKGKEAVQIDPKQPAQNYVEYRRERFRDVGRPVQMPLMLVRLGSEDHNFASARFDAQIYQRGVRRDQSSILRKYEPSLLDVLREAELARKIPMRPCQVEMGAIFQRLPHVDPSKESKARQMDLETMSTTLIDIWAEDGMRPQTMVAKMKRQVDALNEVQEGLGAAYLMNFLKKNSPGTIDKFEEDTTDPGAKKTATTA